MTSELAPYIDVQFENDFIPLEICDSPESDKRTSRWGQMNEVRGAK